MKCQTFACKTPASQQALISLTEKYRPGIVLVNLCRVHHAQTISEKPRYIASLPYPGDADFYADKKHREEFNATQEQS